MKIVLVINELSHKGGAEVFFYNLCNTLSRYSEADLYVVTLYEDVLPCFSLIKNSEKIKYFSCKKRKSLDFASFREYKRIIKSINPDIINLHLNCYINHYFAFGFKKQNWKVVKTFHTIPGQDLNFYTSFIERQMVKKDLIQFIGISKGITSSALDLYPNCNITTINNGIVIPSAKPNDSFERYYDFVIVAALEKVKNHYLLFDSFSNLINQNEKLKLLVVGCGSLKEELQHYCIDKKIMDNVSFYGECDNVYLLLNNARYFVLSSVREGNPISILEAMSQGLTIIAPKIGGIPDVVTDNENGFLYECGNEEELVIAMKKALKCDWKEIHSKNIMKSKEFSMDNTALQYFNCFRKAIVKER